MHTKYEVSTSNGSKVIANVKVDNRQTDRQTDRQTNRQDKNNMPPIIRSGGIKNDIDFFFYFLGIICRLSIKIWIEVHFFVLIGK